MKNNLALIGMAGLVAVLFTSTAQAQKADEKKETKTSRHIKMVKIENGKKVELDTILTNNDVFVWKGDTIGGKKSVKHISSSGTGKMKHIEVVTDGDNKNENIVIYRKKGEKGGKPMIWTMDSDDDMELLTEDSTSEGKRIVIRKRMKDGSDENQMIYFNGADMKHFPPMPPMPPVPPVPHMKMLKMQHAGQIINLNDPNIISYKKKELSGGREKIEIIRKKSKSPANMTFNYKFDDQEITPVAPELLRKFKDGKQNIKVIEKKVKVDGKDGKEIKVEVEQPKENK